MPGGKDSTTRGGISLVSTEGGAVVAAALIVEIALVVIEPVPVVAVVAAPAPVAVVAVAAVVAVVAPVVVLVVVLGREGDCDCSDSRRC